MKVNFSFVNSNSGLEPMRDSIFDNIFKGVKKNKEVICILDDYCVRFVAYVNNKKVYCHEFKDNEKEKCYKLASRYLNK